MLKNEDIICISSIDWDFIWQGHQEVMSSLASQGNRVLFIENTGVRTPNLKDLPRLKKRIHNWIHSVKGIRKERENLYIFSPIVLPFPYSRIARWFNKHLLMASLRRWIKFVGFSNPIIWTFLPTGLALDVINSIDSKLVVYYCIDNFSASSIQARKITSVENKVVQRSDLVFVTSKSLYDRCVRYNKSVHVFPYGISMDVYEKAFERKMDVPPDMVSIKHPIVGYVGGIHKWIDFDLMKSVSKANADKSFVFIGPAQRDIEELKDMANIYFLGQKNYNDLPSYISQFDVSIIPYMLTEYTTNVYPTKINEYLAMGKPVVSTSLPEVVAYNSRNDNIVYIGGDAKEISRCIGKAIDEKDPEVLRNIRREIAFKEGAWNVKIESMCALIEARMAEKEREKLLNWKANLSRLYTRSTRNLIRLAVALAAIYLAVFHTNLVWVAAKPMIISQAPERADCIAVFAGGVGESGKAGQGYEERVGYAVDLYKRGFADRLIFSSGYKYLFEEKLLMKALATALGVPEKDIILEDKSSNTYENVQFTTEIMTKNGWRSVLLVSSPYNMMRASMVFKKISKGVKVICTPIPRSSYYAHEDIPIFRRQINPRQVSGIFHELLGIVYYWWKGYI